jgi:hypothetical protein
MKNRVEDVRNLVVAMMELLDENDVSPEEMASRIERAKTTSQLAGQFAGLVKVEIDAARLLHDTGLLPGAVNEPVSIKPALHAIGGKGA